ncbi:Rho GTPase activation protein, partial [Lipomyces tetrasporus]
MSITALSPSASNTNSDVLSYDSTGLPVPKPQDDFQDPNVFGQPLEGTLQLRGMTVEKRMNSGRLVKYGPIPLIVAVCGLFLEQNGLHVQGIFRVSGSVKRVRELQRIFATEPDFGHNIDWTGYTVHDAASLLRRYLNGLPEPIIPLELYDGFRSPFIHPLSQTRQFKKHEMNEVIVKLHSLIQQLPPGNRQLLLYILDLLELFAKNSKKNMMPASNLAAIFQPCILSHPSHNTLPEEYTTSQEAVLFMIEHFKVF